MEGPREEPQISSLTSSSFSSLLVVQEMRMADLVIGTGIPLPHSQETRKWLWEDVIEEFLLSDSPDGTFCSVRR